jgi:hypothetical protein
MTKANSDAIRMGFGFHLNPLIGAAVIGVPHDITGRFRNGEFELLNAFFLQRRVGVSEAELAHKCAPKKGLNDRWCSGGPAEDPRRSGQLSCDGYPFDSGPHNR